MAKTKLQWKNEGERPELYLYDEIGPAYWGLIDAAAVLEALDEIGPVPELGVRINSPGGEVFEAMAIYNALARFPARVIVDVDALAASAASVIAMVGNTVRVAENAYLMIHRASTIAWGNAEELEKVTGTLRKIDGTIVDAYDARTGAKSDRQQIEAWLDAETWMNASEAVERGFADEVGQRLQVAAAVPAGRFRNAPAEVVKVDVRSGVLLRDGRPGRPEEPPGGRRPAAGTAIAASAARQKIALARRRHSVN